MNVINPIQDYHLNRHYISLRIGWLEHHLFSLCITLMPSSSLQYNAWSRTIRALYSTSTSIRLASCALCAFLALQAKPCLWYDLMTFTTSQLSQRDLISKPETFFNYYPSKTLASIFIPYIFNYHYFLYPLVPILYIQYHALITPLYPIALPEKWGSSYVPHFWTLSLYKYIPISSALLHFTLSIALRTLVLINYKLSYCIYTLLYMFLYI